MASTVTGSYYLQNSGEVRRKSADGPVFITDHGKPAHVLMTIDLYRKLTLPQENIADLLAMPDSRDDDFDVPTHDLARGAEFD